MQDYNQRFGWKLGDSLIKEVALRIKALFKSSFIFRVFGDVIVLNPSCKVIDKKDTIYKLGVGFDPLAISLQHFDLREKTMEKWDQLENYLIHYD